MNRQVDLLKALMTAAGLIACAVPLSSSALLLGELRLHSHLGEPLSASIPLKFGPQEELDGRCFSLSRPESKGDSAFYLTQARLELVETDGQFQIKIRSSQSINEPFLRLLVQENCGQGRLSREYTLLLDPVEYARGRAPSVKPAAVAERQISTMQGHYLWDVRQGETLGSIAASLYPRQVSMQRVFLRAVRDANPSLRDTPADEPLPAGGVIHVPALPLLASASVTSAEPVSRSQRVRPAATKAVADPVERAQPPQPAEQEGGFRLKLSTSALDLSMVGKMTEAQRQHLREKQLLLDADDQVANVLSMKNRIMQLEEQIETMQKSLEQTNSRMLLSEKLAVAPVQKAAPTPPAASTNWTSWLENTSFRGMAGVGLILALLFSGWWRWHRRRAEVQLDSELEHEFAASEMPKFAPSRPEQHHAIAAKSETADQEEDFLTSVTSIFDNEGESVTFTEAESVLDEADLYLAYGWSNRAIDLLQEYLEKHPDDVHLWKKLFEIYSSQGMKQEFEQFALRCQSTLDDSGLWVLVQKLGRQLDSENPLYFSSPEEAALPAAEVEAKIPTLDTPLDFVLDDGLPAQSESDKESKHLELDPLFPELFENTRPFPENGNNDKSSS